MISSIGELILAGLVIAGMHALAFADGNTQEARPSILFIMSDDHTTQAIGAYGSRLAKLNPSLLRETH